MTSVIYSVIMALLVNACSYQCRVGSRGYFSPGSQGFLFNFLDEQVNVSAGDCIEISYHLCYPENDADTPYRGVWFEGDHHRTAVLEEIRPNEDTQTQGVFKQAGLLPGRYRYGFKLEWGDNQRRIFPQRVHVSVSGLRKPNIEVPVLTEGLRARLNCSSTPVCAEGGTEGVVAPRVKWTTVPGRGIMKNNKIGENVLSFTPTAEDHGANITCVAAYPFRNITSETTVTLTVRSRPRFLKASRCVMSGDLLSCVCISQGVPLPVITWPLASVTDYTLAGSGRDRTVNSTITVVTGGKYRNNHSVTCVSSNELGQIAIELPLQNGTVAMMTPTCESGGRVRRSAVAPTWIIVAAVSLCVNVALLLYLIKTCRREKDEKQQKASEDDTYVTLDKADLEGAYSVINPNRSTVL